MTKAAHFEKLMVPHLDAAYNLARWITRNDHDAQDAVQEAYLRAFRYFDSFAGGDGRTWLLTIVRNTCVNLFRNQKAGAIEFDERMHTPASEKPTAEGKMLHQQSVSSLRDCMEALPAEFRETLVMRELEELPYKAIAEVTSLPVGTVMSRLSRARKRLEDCMQSKGEKR